MQINLFTKKIIIFQRAVEFSNLLSAESRSLTTTTRHECRGSKKLASEMITSVGALKLWGAFRTKEEHPGIPSTSSKANPCIMERSSWGHRSCTWVRFSPLSGMYVIPHPHHQPCGFNFADALTIHVSPVPFLSHVGRSGCIFYSLTRTSHALTSQPPPPRL